VTKVASKGSALLFRGGATVAANLALRDWSGTAADLFNNMRTPASLIAAAIDPIMLSPPEVLHSDGSAMKKFKQYASTYLRVRMSTCPCILPPVLGVSLL